jgi:hypothetical protein
LKVVNPILPEGKVLPNAALAEDFQVQYLMGLGVQTF